jgi:hypothetical protein
VEFAQHAHELLGLGGVGEARPAAHVREQHRDLPPMAAQDILVAGTDDRVGELRREEAAEPPEPLELLDLHLDALLEGPIQLLERVVVTLDPEQRTDADE